MTDRQPATTYLLALLAFAAVIGAGYALQHTVSTFLLSFVLAYLLDPLVVVLERRKIRRLYGITILYAILGITCFFCFAYLVPFVNINWDSLLREVPGYLQQVKNLAVGTGGWLQSSSVGEEWRWLIDKVLHGMDIMFNKVSSGIYVTVGRIAFNLLNLLLAPILIFFMLYYKQDVMAGIVGWLPARYRDVVLGLGREINTSVGGYIRGQLITSVIVALLSTMALLALDVDYPVLNGIFAGLSSILPFIGVILATIPPLFFAYVKFQSGIMLFKVALAFGLIYFLEGYVIKPLVFKKAMDLNPLVTIVVVMAFGEVMGFWGILLAIPITAAVKIISVQFLHGSFSNEA